MRLIFVVTGLAALAAFGGLKEASAATVLYAGRAVEVAETLGDPNDLWVLPADLTRVNDFVLKPEGACLDELCIPLQGKERDFLAKRGERTFFSVTQLARTLQQPYAFDAAQDVWSFAPIEVVQAGYHESAMAPDFVLPDRAGNPVRLSGFRGKKVLLFTWASW